VHIGIGWMVERLAPHQLLASVHGAALWQERAGGLLLAQVTEVFHDHPWIFCISRKIFVPK
jgi:hypothetical protein